MGMGGFQWTGLGGAPAGGNGGRQPRSLRCLVNGRMFGSSAGGSSTEELCTANRPGVLEDGVPTGLQPTARIAPLSVPVASLQPDDSLVAAPAAVSSAHTAGPSVQPATTGSAIDDVLDSLSERDEERKVWGGTRNRSL